MSAQGQITNLTVSTLPDGYTFTDGYCSLGEKIEISHGNGDKEILATCGTDGKWWKFRNETDFAEAAQRAADETDGKPSNLAIFGVSTWDDGPPHKPWDEVDGMDWLGTPIEHLCGRRNPYSSGYYMVPCPAADVVHSEPVDVPAVQETHERMWCTAQDGCINAKGERVPEPIDHPPTCADKSRVLLTSEDGKKHCIKF